MASRGDYLADYKQTDLNVQALHSYCGAVEEGRSGDASLAIGLAALALVSAIRETGTLLDYLAGRARGAA